MVTVASLLAAMTIAGAFWVGVLAARRLRDWGDGRRMIEQAELPLALGPGGAIDDPASRRVRALVAERLQTRLARGSASVTPRSVEELTLHGLRVGDVVVVETAESDWDGDYMLEGLALLDEGSGRTTVLVVSDAGRRRWIVGHDDDRPWCIVDPVEDHGLAGEPPRRIGRPGREYTLERRDQSSAALLGRHGRPEGSRVGAYLYRASSRQVLWIERWGQVVLMGEGQEIPAHAVSFLPGS